MNRFFWHLRPTPSGLVVKSYGRQNAIADKTGYVLPLCKKEITFPSGRCLRHVWIDQRRVLAVRGRPRMVLNTILRFFLEQCLCRGQLNQDARSALSDEQVAHLALASLSPIVRHSAQHSVVLAASTRSKAFKQACRELDELLESDGDGELSSTDVLNTCRALIGPFGFERQEELDACVAMKAELVKRARQDLASGSIDFHETKQLWQRWLKVHVRSADPARAALNNLSAQARSALVISYSELWQRVLNAIAAETDLSFQIFHRLWHLEMSWLTKPGAPEFTMFAGQCLALHPLAAMLMNSTAARSRIEELVFGLQQRSTSTDADNTLMRRLLHTWAMAMACYASSYRDDIDRRRSASRSKTSQERLKSGKNKMNRMNRIA